MSAVSGGRDVRKDEEGPAAAGRSKKASPTAPAAKAGAAGSKPFVMSYEGMTQAEYTRYLLDRGSR